MNTRSTLIAIAVAIAGAAPSAHAEMLKYVLSGPQQLTFYLDSETAPTSFEMFPPYVNNFNIDGIAQGTMLVDGQLTSTVFNLRFYSEFNMGGLDIRSATFDAATSSYLPDDNASYFTTGPQLYTGAVDHPTLIAGTFPLEVFIDGGSYTLTVTAVPEPATWGLLAGGLGLVGATARRRREKIVAGA